MDESELVTAVRLAARISSTHPDYPDQRIRQELTDALRTVFLRPYKKAGTGRMEQLDEQPILSGIDLYAIPQRAIVAGLVTVEASDGSGNVRTLVQYNHRDYAELLGSPGEPRGFIDMGDYLRVVPRPEVSGWTLRQWYKLRAPGLYEKQTAGRVTAVDEGTRTITVNSTPTDRVTALAITTATLIDVVSPMGSHEVHLVSAPISSLGPIVVTGTQDMSRVRVGDYVRAADQSDWPMLPPEFHRTLADAAAVVILADQGTPDKAAMLADKVRSDVERLVDLLEPRVDQVAKPMVPRFGPIRSYRSRRTPPARL